MDFINISREVVLSLEGNDKIRILKNSVKSPVLLTEEQKRKKILELELSYAFHSSQNDTIDYLKKAFKAEDDGIIKKVPKSKYFCIETVEDVTVLKYGNTEISPSMLGLAEKVGIVGYWDHSNLIICCSKEYKQIMNKIISMLKPFKSKFEVRMDSWGPNLKIVAI